MGTLVASETSAESLSVTIALRRLGTYYYGVCVAFRSPVESDIRRTTGTGCPPSHRPEENSAATGNCSLNQLVDWLEMGFRP